MQKSIFVFSLVLLISISFWPREISSENSDGIAVETYAKKARIFVTPFRIYEESKGSTDWMRRVRDVNEVEKKLKIAGVEDAYVESPNRVIVWKADWEDPDVEAIKKILVSCKCS